MKKVNTLFAVVCVLLAFIAGQYFEQTKKRIQNTQEVPRVFIEQLKTKMNISKNREDIQIYLNGVRQTNDIKLFLK